MKTSISMDEQVIGGGVLSTPIACCLAKADDRVVQPFVLDHFYGRDLLLGGK